MVYGVFVVNVRTLLSANGEINKVVCRIAPKNARLVSLFLRLERLQIQHFIHQGIATEVQAKFNKLLLQKDIGDQFESQQVRRIISGLKLPELGH